MPEYNGQVDIKYFFDQFHEVAEANHWDSASSLIHLRENLKDKSNESGRSPTMREIEARVRGQFRITSGEARTKVARIKHSSKVPLQQYGNEVGQLVILGYAELEACQQRHLAIKAFANSFDHPQLQRHLLSVNTPDLPSTVRASNEFLSIKIPATSSVRQVEGEEDKQVAP